MTSSRHSLSLAGPNYPVFFPQSNKSCNHLVVQATSVICPMQLRLFLFLSNFLSITFADVLWGCEPSCSPPASGKSFSFFTIIVIFRIKTTNCQPAGEWCSPNFYRESNEEFNFFRREIRFISKKITPYSIISLLDTRIRFRFQHPMASFLTYSICWYFWAGLFQNPLH